MLRQVELMTLITEHGPLDLCFIPDGFPDGFTTLSEHASVIEFAAVGVPVASLEDVVASKTGGRTPQGRRCTSASRSPSQRGAVTHRR